MLLEIDTLSDFRSWIGIILLLPTCFPCKKPVRYEFFDFSKRILRKKRGIMRAYLLDHPMEILDQLWHNIVGAEAYVLLNEGCSKWNGDIEVSVRGRHRLLRTREYGCNSDKIGIALRAVVTRVANIDANFLRAWKFLAIHDDVTGPFSTSRWCC